MGAGTETPQDQGCKGSSERAVLLVAARSQDFVQGASRETAAGQSPIDRFYAEGQDPVCRRGGLLDPPNAPAQFR